MKIDPRQICDPCFQYSLCMKVLVYSLVLSLLFSQFASANPFKTGSEGIWTQLCSSGQWIRLDIDPDKEKTPERPQHTKICHAVCCSSKDEDCTIKKKRTS